MTVSSQTNNETFIGNGVTTIWDLPFRFFSNDQIFVYLIDPVALTTTPMVLGTDYTLTGAGLPEQFGTAPGKLTTTAPVASLKHLFVERVMEIEQLTDIVNQGRFFPEVHEDVFDRLTMLIQQSDANSRGAIRVAIGDPEPSRLPSALLRANLLMGFDSLGNPYPAAPTSGSSADLALLLANAANTTQGAALIGRGLQVVKTIAELKTLLSSTPSKHAFVMGYYAQGDGGGGEYYLDPADAVSADNGGTVIVSADGGRWKLKHAGVVHTKQFGAKGDNAQNDTAFVQAALNTGLDIIVDPGVYRHTGLTITDKNSQIIRGPGGIYKSQFLLTVTGNSLTLVRSINIELHELGFTSDGALSGTAGVVTDAFSSLRVYKGMFYRFKGPGVRMGGTFTNQIGGCIIRDSFFLSCGTDGVSPQLECNYSQDYSYTGNQLGSIGPFGPSNRPALGVRMTACSNGYFADNLIWQCGAGALFQSGCNYNRITNNRFEESQQAGLVFSFCDENIIMGNWINDNSLQTTNTYDGFGMFTCTNNTVVGNIVYNWEQPAILQRNSFIVGNASTGNTFSGNKSRYTGTSHFVVGSDSPANSFDKTTSYSATTNLAAASTTYFGAGGASASLASAEIAIGRIIAVSLTLQLSAAPGAGQSVTATLMVNGVAAGLSTTVSDAAFASFGVGSVEITANSTYNVRVTYSATAAASIPRVALSATSI